MDHFIGLATALIIHAGIILRVVTQKRQLAQPTPQRMNILLLFNLTDAAQPRLWSNRDNAGETWFERAVVNGNVPAEALFGLAAEIPRRMPESGCSGSG